MTARSPRWTLLIAWAAVAAGAGASFAEDPIFDAKGFQPNREMVSQLSFEHIDPMTGNVLLTFTDLTLPGNAGFDLKIQRTYNSKIYATYSNTAGWTLGEDSWAGLGWTLHLGRVIDPDGTPNQTPHPVIEMPDGGKHQTYWHMDGNPRHYITKDFWTYEVPVQGPPVLRLPNGVRYFFGHTVGSSPTVFYVTQIRDAFDNAIDITYFTAPKPGDSSYPVDGIQQIVQHVGSDVRTITFDYDHTLLNGNGDPIEANSLKSMELDAAGFLTTWAYGQTLSNNFTHTLLREVKPPEIPAWQFDYYLCSPPNVPPNCADIKYELKSVALPSGGTITYTYKSQLFWLGTGGVLYSPALDDRITTDEGNADFESGTWSYVYTNQPPTCSPTPCVPVPMKTEVTGPCGKTTYLFRGLLNGDNQEEPWATGAQASRRLEVGSDPPVELEEEIFTWEGSDPISNDDESPAVGVTRVALLKQRAVARDGLGNTPYQTTHTYAHSSYDPGHAANFSDFGRPERSDEEGNVTAPNGSSLIRKTTRTFFYPPGGDPSFGTYIVDRTSQETVTTLQGSTQIDHDFIKDSAYNPQTGFLDSQSIYGVATQFWPDAFGNVERMRDASGKENSYAYKWGVAQRKSTPEYDPQITREINPEGTIHSETRRGFTTTFEYDDLFRLRKVTPAISTSNETNTTYFSAGNGWSVQRGQSLTTTLVDGFGRVKSTTNNVGVKTHTKYDACGWTSYESYPFEGGADVGTTYVTDGLGRVREKRNPNHPTQGQTKTTYDYAGLQVTITDEESRATLQDWRAFGDPGDARLANLTDAGSGPDNQPQTTSYEYNTLGSLTKVTAPDNLVRQWVYDARNQLQSETHPEAGTITYGYYANGNLQSRTDPAFGATVFTYDGNSRLTLVDRAGQAPDTEIGYDASDNRTLLKRGNVRSVFGPYDGANRLPQREDHMQGRTFTTSYGYDGNDNVSDIDYPMGGHVRYEYDHENRITEVTDGDSLTFADTFDYHASGGIESYRAGNGLFHDTEFDASRYWVNRTRSPGVFDIQYTLHDRVGNVTDIDEQWTGSPPSPPQHFAYDRVDRLTSAAGFWPVIGLTYDPLGNRTFRTTPPAGTEYHYNSATNRLEWAQTGKETEYFGYDANGNIESDGSGTYTYTPENMMETATVASGGTTSYQYDGDNLRKVKIGDGSFHYFVHGPGNQILSELQSSGAGEPQTVRNYVYAGTRLIASVKPAALTVDPASLTFAMVVGGPLPPTATLNVDTGTPMGWAASEQVPWLTLSAQGGTTPATVTVFVNAQGLQLPVGTHVGEVTFTADAIGSPQVVEVRLVVTSQPGLVVVPQGLSFVMNTTDGDPPPQTMDVVMAGSAQVTWDADVSAPWITLSPGSGTTPSTVLVSVDGAGLAPGTHSGVITVTAPPGTNGSPRFVPVQLAIQPGVGAPCEPGYFYCETFDAMQEGDIDGQGGWVSTFEPGQVQPDNRGIGKVLLLDPVEDQINDAVEFAPHPIDAIQISMQVMTREVPVGNKQIAKVEFYTECCVAWGKTGRTFGALRFGSALYVQYGPNVYQLLVAQVEADRWYDVKVVYQGTKLRAYVDGALMFETVNPLAPGHPVEAFVTTGWMFAGQAFVDHIDGRPLATGLVVEPSHLEYEVPSNSLGEFQGRIESGGSEPSRVAEAFGRLPLTFEANQGQADPRIRFLANGSGYRIALGDREAALTLGGPSGPDVRLRFAGSDPDAKARGQELLTGRSHYFRGSDPTKWLTNVPHYGKVRLDGVYPGIDVVFRGNQRQLEYDVILGPGSDPDVIRLDVSGVAGLRVDGDDLVVDTPAGEVRHRKPVAYQEDAGGRHHVPVRYVLKEHGRIGFQVAGHDVAQALVIDPVIVYSTFVRDPHQLDVKAVAVDADGATYLASGGIGEGPDIVVTKINPEGTALVYSTHFGGTVFEDSRAIAVDSAGNAYVVGITSSPDFPTVNPVQGEFQGGSYDAFVTKLDATGASLLYSTYLGGVWTDYAYGIAVDAAGQAYVAGETPGSGFPTTRNAFQASYQGGFSDGFLTKFSAGGAPLLYSTFLGGSDFDTAAAVALDPAGNAYITGGTSSTSFPTTPGAFDRTFNAPGGNYGADAFVSKFNTLVPGAAGLLYSTYLGGWWEELGLGIGVDATGSAFVAGPTLSDGTGGNPPFPTTPGAFQTTHAGGGYDGFVTRLNSSGSALLFSTFLGGTAADFLSGVAVDPAGSAYVVGNTQSQDFPTVDPIQGSFQGATDFSVTKFAGSGSVLYSTYLGGSEAETAAKIAVDAFDSAYVAGTTTSPDFPLVNPLYNVLEGSESFLTKITGGAGGPTSTSQVRFSDAAYRFDEPPGAPGGPGIYAVLTVTRTGDLSTTATVSYRTANGTATGGLDYTAGGGTLTFLPGEAALPIVVTILPDLGVEGDETFSVGLVRPGPGVSVEAPSTAVVTIGDNDGLSRTLTIRDIVLPVGPNWDATVDVPWLTLSAYSGTGPSLVTATVNPAHLPPGTYMGTIQVQGDTGNSPQTVPVTLVVH